MTRCLFEQKNSKWFVLAAFLAILSWSIVGAERVYSAYTEIELKPRIYPANTYQPKSTLKTKKVKAGVYRLAVVQPLTLYGQTKHASINYRIVAAMDGKTWTATRTAVFSGVIIDLGADVFRTKGDAVRYISKIGHQIDYGRQANIERFYYE